MSKLIDRLKRTSNGEPKPMGFTARQAAQPKPKIQVVASLSGKIVSGPTTGADAGLLNFSKSNGAMETLQKLAKSSPDAILGVRLSNGSQDDIKQLSKNGADFIVFAAAGAPLAIIEDGKELGKVLEVESSVNEGILRTANELPVDAVLIAAEEKAALTFHDLMLFQRFSDLLSKPLLVPAPSQVTASELQALWDAGVSGIVINVGDKQAEESLAKLGQEIDKLDFSPRHARKGGALLPSPRQPGRRHDDDDEEEDDDDE